MLSSIFINFDISKNIEILDKIFANIVKNYNFINVNSTFTPDENQDIFQHMLESKIVIISQFIESNQDQDLEYFIVAFEKTIIIIKQCLLQLLNQLFMSHSCLQICFLSNTKDIFDKFNDNKINYSEIQMHENFFYELTNITQSLFMRIINSSFVPIFNVMQTCILAYLLKKSYIKLNRDRIKTFCVDNKNSTEIKKIGNNNFFHLRQIDNTLQFEVELVYYIEKEELLIVKKSIGLSSEIPKLIKREIENYSKIKFPFIPNFYGIIKETGQQLIEYINGYTLMNIKYINLNENDKINIIFELMLTIDFLHHNSFIYRDLKPNNVIIDDNKTAVLIDFDRMINIEDVSKDSPRTFDLSSPFLAPEVNSGKFSYECDIYSLGCMIYYIMNEKNPFLNGEVKNNYPRVTRLFEKCTNSSPEKRPSISEIILEFAIDFKSQIRIENLFEIYEKHYQNLYDMKFITILKDILNKNYFSCGEFIIGTLYESGSYISQDINKAIQHYSLAAEQNNVEAQLKLGQIYYSNEYNKININKAIYYYSLAANQNNIEAQKILGQIYCLGQHLPQDIEKGIYYYTLAANQNDKMAQFNLGSLYLQIDFNKAIYFLSLAADQNVTMAQMLLAKIYLSDEYTSPDLNKAIHYYSLASDQNEQDAQLALGIIFLSGIYIERDIAKAVHYFTLAANQNNIEAQRYLGSIYYTGEYCSPDIEKSIHFFSLAAQQNSPEAQFSLGVIYYSGNLMPRDIDKAIYYLSLAANQYNTEAQLFLGDIYCSGKYALKSIDKAIYYYSLAASKNNVKAQKILGDIYYFGEYVPRDINKAIYYYSLAVNQDSTEAQLALGNIYCLDQFQLRNYDKAVYYYSLAANKNNSDAQFMLGKIYCSMQTGKHDIYKAIHYFSLSAKQNNAKAQYALGSIYLTGDYYAADINKAIHFFKLAADNNYSKAQFALGSIYCSGNYVSVDFDKGLHYYLLAAKNNDPNAQLDLAQIYYSGKNVQRDVKKAVHYYILSANQNNPKAQYNLAILHLNNYFGKQKASRALKYLILSSNNGNIRSHFALGYLYHEGKCIERDIEKAIHFYKLGSSFNDQYAKNNLGIIYKNGFNDEIPKNVAYAIELFNESIKQKNDLLSKYNLANIYFFDQTVKKNDDKLMDLLFDSSKQDFIHSQELLCLVLISKYGSNINDISEILSKRSDVNKRLITKICNMILREQLINKYFFSIKYRYLEKTDYLYDFKFNKHPTKSIMNVKRQNIVDINSHFYEGFGNGLISDGK